MLVEGALPPWSLRREVARLLVSPLIDGTVKPLGAADGDKLRDSMEWLRTVS
jgi:hypothetical protein